MTYKFVPYPKWIHHPEHRFPSELVHDEDGEAEVLKRWELTQEDADLAVDTSRDNLLKRATKLQIKVDQRWSDSRLKRAVEEAEDAA